RYRANVPCWGWMRLAPRVELLVDGFDYRRVDAIPVAVDVAKQVMSDEGLENASVEIADSAAEVFGWVIHLPVQLRSGGAVTLTKSGCPHRIFQIEELVI